jgi:hypothetical protein
MSDKIEKKGRGADKRLVKSNGSPDFSAMRKKIGIKTTQCFDKSKFMSSLQVVFMFDITGSTFAYFDIIREKLQEIIEAVKTESPGAQFAIFAFRNHGDEDRYQQIYYTSPLTADFQKIQNYIVNIERGGGGPDALTCMEECLYEANRLDWGIKASKAVVVIGDMPPHGVVDSVSKCYANINYKDEILNLRKKDVRFYSVFCPTHKNDRIYRFFQSLAEDGNGKFMEISEIELLSELLIGICLKETGQFDEFKKRVSNNPNLSASQKKKLLALKG